MNDIAIIINGWQLLWYGTLIAGTAFAAFMFGFACGLSKATKRFKKIIDEYQYRQSIAQVNKDAARRAVQEEIDLANRAMQSVMQQPKDYAE